MAAAVAWLVLATAAATMAPAAQAVPLTGPVTEDGLVPELVEALNDPAKAIGDLASELERENPAFDIRLLEDGNRNVDAEIQTVLLPDEPPAGPWLATGGKAEPAPAAAEAEAPPLPDTPPPSAALEAWTNPPAQELDDCPCVPEAVPTPEPPEPALSAAVHGAPPPPSLLAAAAPAGAAVVGGLLLWRLLAALLARRDSELHPRAQAILAAVCATPGLSFRGLRQATGLANGVALHHVARLLRDGHIVAHPHRNTVRFFENHGRYARTWKEAAVLREPLNRRLLAWLSAHPGATQSDVVVGSRAWGWRRGLTQKRLALLEEAGLVSRARDGRAVRYLARSASAVAAAPLPGHPAALAPMGAGGGLAASAAKL